MTYCLASNICDAKSWRNIKSFKSAGSFISAKLSRVKVATRET